MSEVHGREGVDFAESYRGSLQKAFESYFRPHTSELTNPRVLSVGCGFGYEAPVITSLFPDAHYEGIDIKPELIFGAGQVNKKVSGDISFRVADATKDDSYGNNKWDVVILRHPQMQGSVLTGETTTGTWRTIVQKSMEHLKQGGLLFSTVSSPLEEKLLSQALSVEDAEILEHTINESANENGTYDDKVVILAKKK